LRSYNPGNVMEVDATARDLFNSALLHSRSRTSGGFLADITNLWIEPQFRIDCWWSGENDKVRVWEFNVADADVEKFLQYVPEARSIGSYRKLTQFKVSIEKA
jgi:hypothetical protein